ncbi:tetratricopeptide repeat protein [Prauserella alba]|uniref:XRE family transcriptional regulator n=1 Tax=Prauserella alba TaxID=176898 RepID=A0ABN1VK55_9PSEU|nr:tetratricopeptide repeat protein [Prauserella alba]MCP2182152.1 Tetratricopeptide repeat-containing protein [Prauserella alba]
MPTRALNAFAAAVHRLRRWHGMSLADLAEKTTYSASYLSKILHGERRLAPALVSEIDDILDAGGELIQLAREQDSGDRPRSRPMQLPAAPADFVGRASILHELDAALVSDARPGAPITAVIEGGFWTGKTALALHWVARIEQRFPGGCLFADLRGLAPGSALTPDEVLDGFLHALDAGPDAMRGTLAERAAHYRSLLAQRPAVVVLDNIASYDQVADLLPGAGSVVVLTSRERQSSLLLRTGGVHITLPPLTAHEALTLLRMRAGHARIDVERDAAIRIAARCGHLPMAILIAAERIQQHPREALQTLAERLDSDTRRLDVFTSSDPAVNVHAVIDLSYLALAPRTRRVFRLAGIIPASLISADAVAVQCGLPATTALDALDELRHAHLVDDAPDHSDQVQINDLLRSYATGRAIVDDPLSEIEHAHDRLLRWYAATAWRAAHALAPGWADPVLECPSPVNPPFTTGDYEAALAWCDKEAHTIIDIARHARSHNAKDAAWILPTLLQPYFQLTDTWTTWLTAAAEGLAAARDLETDLGIGRCTQSLGWALHHAGHTDHALDHLRQAADLQASSGDRAGLAWSEFATATAYSSAGHHVEARTAYEHAAQLFDQTEFPLGAAIARALLAATHEALGNNDRARAYANDALACVLTIAPRHPAAALAHHQLGIVLSAQQQPRAALTHFDAALTIHRHSHQPRCHAETLEARGNALLALGLVDAARASYRDAMELWQNLHDRRGYELHARMATLSPPDGEARAIGASSPDGADIRPTVGP